MEMSEVDWRLVYETDERAIKDLSDGQSTDYVSYSHLVLIGDGFTPEYYELAERSGGTNGQVTVQKASGVSSGSLTFTNAHSQSELTATIAEFSKKQCIFA